MVLLERGLEQDTGAPKLCYLDTGLPVKYLAWKGLKEELRTEENLFIASEQKSGPIEVFPNARQITEPVAAVKRTVGRANFKE